MNYKKPYRAVRNYHPWQRSDDVFIVDADGTPVPTVEAVSLLNAGDDKPKDHYSLTHDRNGVVLDKPAAPADESEEAAKHLTDYADKLQAMNDANDRVAVNMGQPNGGIMDDIRSTTIRHLRLAAHSLRSQRGGIAPQSEAISDPNRFTDKQVDAALYAFYGEVVTNWPHKVKPLNWSKMERDDMRAALSAALKREG